MKYEKMERCEKYEVKCGVIRDLLPNYMEKLTGPESNQLVEDHLRSCADCRRYASEMGAGLDAPDMAPGADSRDRDIRPFRRLKRKLWRNILLTVLACALVFGGSALYLTHSWTPDFNDVEISCEKNGDVVDLVFSAKDKNTVLASYIGVFCGDDSDADAKDSDECVELAATRKNPLTTPIRKNAYYGYTFIDEDTVYDNNSGRPKDIDEDSYFLVIFGDRSVKINIMDLGEGKVTIME